MKADKKKKSLIMLLIVVVVFSNIMNIYAGETMVPSFKDTIISNIKTDFPSQVKAEVIVDSTAEAGKPFTMSIMLHMPKLMTYKYNSELPVSPMYDKYNDVKVIIPIPQGIEILSTENVTPEGLEVSFPPQNDIDFTGDTVKSREISIKVKDNGLVKNNTPFTFVGMKWACNVDAYIDEAKNQKEKIELTGDIKDTVHMATAMDVWGINKNASSVKEDGDQVVFTFDVNTGLEKEKINGRSVLYSNATDQYDRYGRLAFDQYQVSDNIPSLVQVNTDGSEIDTKKYPNKVKVVKYAVPAYNVPESDQNIQYMKGTGGTVSFNEYNIYDPNGGTDTIGSSPQYSSYRVELSYDRDDFMINANDNKIRNFKVTNRAQLNYTLLGESAVTVSDQASASYIIRRGEGRISIKKFLKYPENGKVNKIEYKDSIATKYPIIGDSLSFEIYKDKECTKLAKYVNGSEAIVTYDMNTGLANSETLDAGTYYIKEKGAITHFKPESDGMKVVIPQAGGVANCEFININSDFSSIAIYKAEKSNNGTQDIIKPLSGIQFRLYTDNAKAERFSDVAGDFIKTGTTDVEGVVFYNELPTGTYYVREELPTAWKDVYKANNNVYTMVVNNKGTDGLKLGETYYGTISNPIVNERIRGKLYLGVVDWSVKLKSEEEINYLVQSNQVNAVAESGSAYQLELYVEKDGNIIPYIENGSQVVLTTDKNGIVSKSLPAGKYYVVEKNVKTKYTVWAQGNQKNNGKYFMGGFEVRAGEDNYTLPTPDKDGNVNWNAFTGAADHKKNYQVIHNFSAKRNLSLKKLGDGRYVVPEARFDLYKIPNKGADLTAGTKIKSDIKTNNKAYAFFAGLEDSWYSFVETATGPQYYLPEYPDNRQDVQLSVAVFNQDLKGSDGLSKQIAQMEANASLVFFNNPIIGTDTPIVGVTFKKIDSETKEQLHNGAKYNVYYKDDNGNRVYLKGYYYHTKNEASKTYIIQGDKYVPAFADDTTTMVGIIPKKLLDKDIRVYVEEITAPMGYQLPTEENKRIKSVVVKGGTIDTKNIVVMENDPFPPSVSLTVAVSNRNFNQSVSMSEGNRGTFVEGSEVRLYEWEADKNNWKYVASKNTETKNDYITESGAIFNVSYGKTYAIAEKKYGNKGNLEFAEVGHKWIKSDSLKQLKAGDGKNPGTYKLEYQGTVDGQWNLYGPITMPISTEKPENYKFTFYNVPERAVWFGKKDAVTDEDIKASGYFKVYNIPDGETAYSDVSKLNSVGVFSNNGGYRFYKGVKLPMGNYVIVENRAPSGYSNAFERTPFSIDSNVRLIPTTTTLGIQTYMYNFTIKFLENKINRGYEKTVKSPTGALIGESLLGDTKEKVKVSYSLSNLNLNNDYTGIIKYKNCTLVDSGLEYFAGQNGNGDKITLNKGDYTINSIDIPKATNYSDFINCQVYYKTFSNSTWTKAGSEIQLKNKETNVNMEAYGSDVTQIKIEYLNAEKGLTTESVTVNATINKRDVEKFQTEILSIKNISNYSYDYAIPDEKGNLTYNKVSLDSNAIINVDPTLHYPRVKILKDAEIVREEKNIKVAKRGDKIKYTITLENTQGNPYKQPIILDKLPEQVQMLANGNSNLYYNVIAPAGIKVKNDAPIIKMNNDNGTDVYAFLAFDGELKEHEKIIVTFETKVKVDAVVLDNLIKNKAATSSTIKGSPNNNNILKASFKDANGVWPIADTAYDKALSSIGKTVYGYITSSVDNSTETETGVTIKKYVKGEIDFLTEGQYKDYISYTTKNGRVYYKIVVQNNGDEPVSKIRIADLLPQTGDGGNRDSQWKPTFENLAPYSIYKANSDGTFVPLKPTVYTDEGVYQDGLRLGTKDWSSGWKTDPVTQNTTAIGFDCGGTTLNKGEYIVVELRMKAPNDGIYAGKFIGNDGIYYANIGTRTDQMVTSKDVFTAFSTKPVGIGGTLWLDKNQDGKLNDIEKTSVLSKIPVKLNVYLNDKLDDVLTTTSDINGNYYFDNLMPSFVDKGKFTGKGHYQYQVEYGVPKGTSLTNNYKGGAAAWENNLLGAPGVALAPKTVDDPTYTDNGRAEDSNGNVETHKSEIFYLNECPDELAETRTEAAGYDLTYDAGYIRTRDIAINKTDGEGKPLPGAKFKLTGGLLPTTGIIRESGQDGKVSFANPLKETDGSFHTINYYDNYVVEEIEAPVGYVNSNWKKTILSGEDMILDYEGLNKQFVLNHTVVNDATTTLTIEKTVAGGTNEDLNKEFRFQTLINGSQYKGKYYVSDKNSAASPVEKDTSSSEGYILLKHGESAQIRDLESGQKYSVLEQKEDKFTAIATNSGGTLSNDNKKNVATFVNEKDKGYVKLTKKYVGSSLFKGDDFEFSVKVNGQPYVGEYYINNVAYQSTDGKVILKADQETSIAGGIGQTFEIVENVDARYKTTIIGSAGVIVENNLRKVSGEFSDTIQSANYTNEIEIGGLVISKKVDNDPQGFCKDIWHNFYVESEGKPYVGDYTYYPVSGNPSNKEIKFTTDGKIKVRTGGLAHIEKLPKASKYKVTEIIDPTKSQYQYTTNDNGILSVTIGSNTEANFVNTLKVQNISINKIVNGDGADVNLAFEFMMFINGKKVKSINYEINGKPYTVNNGIMKIRHNQTAVIKGIPQGVKYRVIEIPADNYQIEENNASGTVSDREITVTFTNTKLTDESVNIRMSIRKKVVSDFENDYDREYVMQIGFQPEKGYFVEESIIEAPSHVRIRNNKTGEVKNFIKNDSNTIKSGQNERLAVPIHIYEEIIVPDELFPIFLDKTDPNKCLRIKVLEKEGLGNTVFTDNSGYRNSNYMYRMAKNQKSLDLEVTCTNTRSADYNLVTITKRWNGNEYSKENNKIFDLYITENSSGNWLPYSGPLTYSNSPRPTQNDFTSDGHANLMADESVTIDNRVYDTNYIIKEIDEADIYDTKYVGVNNSFQNTSKNVTITNSIKQSTLCISKTNIGGNALDDFTFNVEIQGKKYAGPYKKTDANRKVETLTMSEGVLTLKGNETALIEQLNPNMTYVVEETPDPRYVANKQLIKGVTVKELKMTAEFINTIKEPGLTIAKTNIGGNPNDLFDFDLVIKDLNSDKFVPYTGSYSVKDSKGATLDKVTSNGRIQLRGSEAAIIKNISVGSKYEITEIPNEKYNQTANKGAFGTILMEGSVAQFENTIKRGQLEIEKVRVGGKETDSFTFDVLLDGKAAVGTYDVYNSGTKQLVSSDQPINNGKVIINGGQYAVIANIVEGTEYRINETDRKDYSEDKLGAIGIIESSPAREVFTNTKISKELIITKTAIGGNPEDTFEFIVNTGGSSYIGEYTITKNGLVEHKTTTDGKIVLKSQQVAKIKVDSGTSYSVIESAKQDYQLGEVVTENFSEDQTNQSTVTVNGATVSGNINGNNIRINYNNLYTAKGSLEISKTRIGGSPLDKFTFNLAINEIPYAGTCIIYNEEGTLVEKQRVIGGKITITGGGKALVSGLEYNDTYTVSEEQVIGYEPVKGTISGTIEMGTAKEGYISPNVAEYTNIAKDASISVTKRVKSGDMSSSYEFVIEKESENQFVPEENVQYLLYEESAGGIWTQVYPEKGSGESYVVGGGGTFLLKGNQKAVFSGLQDGMQYKLKEKEYENCETTVSLNGGTAQTSNYRIVTTDVQKLAEIEFNNQVIFQHASVILTAKKVLNNKNLIKDQFSFTLYENDKAIVTAKNTEDGTITFPKIDYSEPGAHSYTIKEDLVNDNHIAMDLATFEVIVNVVDDGHGKLTANTFYPPAGILFTNTYTPDQITLQLDGTKHLAGADLKDHTFTFKVIEGTKEVATGTNDAQGKITFTPIAYELKDVGAHNYKVTEVKGTNNGMTYDTTVFDVNVAVTNDNGVLKAAPINPPAIVFNNNYTTDDSNDKSIQLEGTKTLTGADLKDNKFKFEVKEKGVKVADGISDDKGVINFGLINYEHKDIGTHVYTITEVNEHKTGITYDATSYQVTVDVEDNHDGTIKITPHYPNGGVVFKNTYTTPSVDSAFIKLEGTKQLLGENLSGYKFKFQVKEDDKVICTGESDASGHIEFPYIFYHFIGTHNYEISEINDGQQWIDYNEKIYPVTVTVKYGNYGVLTAEAKYQGTDKAAIFVNGYNGPKAEVSIAGTKKMIGANLKSEQFEFALSSGGKVIDTATNKKDGTFAFDTIAYEKSGVYFYSIEEKNEKLDGIVYDRNKFGIKVTVTEAKNGELTATKEYQNGDVVFRNVKINNETGDKGNTNDPQTGDNQPIGLWLAFGGDALALLILVLIRRRIKEDGEI